MGVFQKSPHSSASLVCHSSRVETGLILIPVSPDPFSSDITKFPSTDLARVTSGVVRGGEARLVLVYDSLEVEELNIVIVFLDGKPRWIPVDTPATEGVELTRNVPLPTDQIIHSIVVIASIQGAHYRLSEDPKRSCLSRILSLDMKAVNYNLRWHTRIRDLETRFFSAKNSIAATPDNYDLHARCMVAVGYRAIENNRADMTEWSRRFCHERFPEMMATPDVHVRSSVLVFWIHEAVMNTRLDDILRISEILTKSFKGINKYPMGTYNSLHAILLIGSFLLFSGNLSKARRIFRPFDRHFKIAANKYSRSLINYLELTKIAECTYLCKLGLEMASGQKVRDRFGPFTPELAWGKGQRFVDKDVSEQGRRRYLELIQQYKQQNAS